ncbi:hypothetical protein pb186bvf_007531 [Paramecium bursaria]
MEFHIRILFYKMDLQMNGEADLDLNNPITWINFVILGSLVGLSQAGGIGGGPIISPVMMILLSLPSKNAIWNTYIMLLGGSLGNFLRLGKEKTASGSAPLINYQLVLITIPLLLAGAVFGVATGKWLPKIVIIVFLFAILISVFKKTLQLYKNLKAAEDFSFENQSLLMKDIKQIQREQENPELLEILEKEGQLYPLEQIKELGIQVAIVLSLTLIKGSQSFPSMIGVEYCSSGYHFINVILLAIAVYNVYRYRNIILQEEVKKEQVGYHFQEGRMSSVIGETVKSSFFAGFLGGLVGLGGGVILTPLWLSMGIPSSRATASATFCVLFTSSISVFIITLSGGYHIKDFILYGGFSGVGSYIIAGQLKVLVKRYHRESILIMVLLGIITLGLIVLPYQSFKDFFGNPKAATQFGRFC